jgi:transposase
MSARAASLRFGVSINTGIRWLRRYRETGLVEGKRRGGNRPSPLDRHADWLLGLIAATPDLTLAEIKAELPSQGLTAGIGSIWRFYDRHGISFKKSGARRRAGPDGRGGGAGGVESGPARP